MPREVEKPAATAIQPATLYRDIPFLLDAIMSAGIDLPTAMAAATFIDGSSFKSQITLKAFSTDWNSRAKH